MRTLKLRNFESKGVSQEKKQIVLTHTSRKIGNYISSLNYRYIKNKKIPNYLISREGDIYKLLDDYEYTDFFENKSDRQIISISLENLGWLEKVPLQSYHINWCGDIYYGDIFSRKWRDYFLWQPYTDIQVKKLSELCIDLLEKYSIDKKIIGHNTQVDFIENFRGICTRANFNKTHTDLSPAFDFENFEKKLKDV
jgi:hypothetical protein